MLEQLEGARFLQQFKFPLAFLCCDVAVQKNAGNCCKNCAPPSCSYIIFPLNNKTEKIQSKTARQVCDKENVI